MKGINSLAGMKRAYPYDIFLTRYLQTPNENMKQGYAEMPFKTFSAPHISLSFEILQIFVRREHTQLRMRPTEQEPPPGVKIRC